MMRRREFLQVGAIGATAAALTTGCSKEAPTSEKQATPEKPATPPAPTQTKQAVATQHPRIAIEGLCALVNLKNKGEKGALKVIDVGMLSADGHLSILAVPRDMKPSSPSQRPVAGDSYYLYYNVSGWRTELSVTTSTQTYTPASPSVSAHFVPSTPRDGCPANEEAWNDQGWLIPLSDVVPGAGTVTAGWRKLCNAVFRLPYGVIEPADLVTVRKNEEMDGKVWTFATDSDPKKVTARVLKNVLRISLPDFTKGVFVSARDGSQLLTVNKPTGAHIGFDPTVHPIQLLNMGTTAMLDDFKLYYALGASAATPPKNLPYPKTSADCASTVECNCCPPAGFDEDYEGALPSLV